jgi:hypothetical protein
MLKQSNKEEPKYHDFSSELIKNTGDWKHKIIIGTPVTGLVRIEWVLARYGQMIPTNWSMADVQQWMPTTAPLQYVVSDAQNIIVRKAIEQDAEWLFLLEHDNLLPPNTFWLLTDYMRRKTIPVVSGLYFTKSNPPEPMIYRGKGNSYYEKWKLGDKVWCDGIPTGCTLIHMSIIREMWNDSTEYKVGNQVTRKVYSEPAKIWFDQKKGILRHTGTSDLAWCDRVRKEKYLERAGWKKYQKKRYPFLVDTNIFVRHITEDGVQYPLSMPDQFVPKKKKKKGKHGKRHLVRNKSK